ncbi:Cyclin-dependent kinase inhibitor 3 (CDKN3) [uncultured virus]|nr:Cyclin-dependent kinase inhibitor 3 (CDKN3) [uncultured virus]
MAYQYEFARETTDNGTIITQNSPNYFNLDKRITSEQNPYKIVDIAYVVDPLNPNKKGRLSLSICPGKKDKKSNRDLRLDLENIKANGIQVIVCLLEWGEMSLLNVIDYPRKAQEIGFVFYHMPIRDRGITTYKELSSLIPIIVSHLSEGHNVLVHCRSGLGRAGTICACCLGHFGYNGNSAIGTVRKQRPGAIQTDQQETSVFQYCSVLVP